ncbi:hypothetical protein [Cupriavidus sp. AcVe19-6a]|uniref:hypothetical protein n=1 Tax=Cupriavidus sp. AcVe19-6a TaxID=2821358 RepID=UPI001AE67329|nr:hypothetical protein [Cupriavidus sp. AcVe19-6a]MBP0633957.1 hypothetical protein [Cupriavidus sp. AcVe19-6a]
MTRTLTLIALAAGATLSAGALAKLPPPSEAQQAKAAETKARAAWSDKVAAFQLCRAQDRIATRYYAERQAQGKDARAAVQTAACADPGPFVAPVSATPPAAPPTAPVPAVASTGPDAKPVAPGAVQSPAKAP